MAKPLDAMPRCKFFCEMYEGNSTSGNSYGTSSISCRLVFEIVYFQLTSNAFKGKLKAIINEIFLNTFLKLIAPVAQLDRASDCGSEGQRFESSRVRHLLNSIYN